jgi:hypothetical protein
MISGRQNKLLVIRFIKVNNIHHIVVTKKRSHSTARLDCIGKIGEHKPYTFCRINFTKLTKYLLEKNILFSIPFAKFMGIDTAHLQHGKMPKYKKLLPIQDYKPFKISRKIN